MVESHEIIYLTEDKGVSKKILLNGDQDSKPQKG